MKNEKYREIPPKSWNLAQPNNWSRSFRFCACGSHICFSVKSLNFSVSVLDFKMPVSASRRVTDLPFATPNLGFYHLNSVFMDVTIYYRHGTVMGETDHFPSIKCYGTTDRKGFEIF